MRLVILFLFLFPLQAISQNFIGKTKKQVKKEIERFTRNNDTLTIVLNDNDTAFHCSYRGEKTITVNAYYGFDRKGRCRSERMVAGCDSCFTKYLAGALNEKRFGWKKINENQYISKYSERMMIELPLDNKDFSYTILRTDWTKEQYELLIGN